MAINTPKPISRDERYLSKIGGNEETIVPKPISREEKYMYRAAGYDDQPIPDYPIGRNEKYWAKIVENGGGGGKLVTKTIVENGQYNATDDNADGYSSVDVNVPNTYTSSDEGKVVDNGSLVSQTGITVTENGTIDTTLNNQVIVDVPTAPTPAPSVKSGAVFRDYDGTIVYSYTKEQVAELSELPAGPTHDGLSFQKWNWSLSNIKSYVNKCDYVEVGATYITDDGKTRIYITLPEGRLFPKLGLAVNGSVDIDWGDGSAHDTMTGTNISSNQFKEHQYTKAGDYIITLDVTGTIRFNGNSKEGGYILHKYGNTINAYEHKVYTNCITKIHIGSGVTSIDSNAFSSCHNLTSITIPDGVTSIGSNAFSSCYNLTSITIPDGVTSIGSNAFSSCYSLTSITIPDGVTSIGNSAFSGCYNLTSITIPDGVTSIGSDAFSSCYNLTSITIPDELTSIGNSVFSNCHNLTSITIPDGVTSIDTSAFQSCSSLISITIPDGVTSIGAYIFSNNFSLTSITIPDGVTRIDTSAFTNCYSLASITIPDRVTSIGSGAFQNCYGLGFLKFESTTPPTVSNSNAFAGLPTDCIIMVPTGSLAAYTSATNYPSSSLYTYVEY